MSNLMRAVRVHDFGASDRLQLQRVPVPQPGSCEVLINVEYAGVNMVDVYYRKGWYKPNATPFIPGMEVSGTVASVGLGVSEFIPGDRVVSVMTLGGYAECQVVPVSSVIKLPDGLETRIAAATALQGLTAYFLSHVTYRLKPGETVLVHAAAGGVGGLLCQLARHRGATVIGTVSTDEKEVRARQCGCHHVIRYDQKEFSSEILSLTSDVGVSVVYDSVGQDTFNASMRCLKTRGMLILFGQSSGEVPPFDPQLLRQFGSIYLTRPTLSHYMAPRQEFLCWAAELFRLIRDGEIKIKISDEVTLSNVARAHDLLESRRVAGKILIRINNEG